MNKRKFYGISENLIKVMIESAEGQNTINKIMNDGKLTQPPIDINFERPIGYGYYTADGTNVQKVENLTRARLYLTGSDNGEVFISTIFPIK